SADGAELVLAPGKSHGAGAVHAAEGGPQAGNAATGRGAGDGTFGFRADREAHATSGGGRGGPGGGSAGALAGLPGIARLAAEPYIVLGEGAEAELGDQHRPGGVEAFDHGGVVIEALVLIGLRAPGGGISLGGEQVLGAPGDAVQRAAVAAAGNVLVGLARLRQGALLGVGDDEMELRIVAPQAGQI